MNFYKIRPPFYVMPSLFDTELEDALEKGLVFDAGYMSRAASGKVPWAVVSKAAWEVCVKPPENAQWMNKHERLWNLLWAMRSALINWQMDEENILRFSVTVKDGDLNETEVNLKAVIGIEHDWEVCFVVMLPWEG